MVRYNIEVKYLCFGKEHTSEVYYNALDNLNEEEINKTRLIVVNNFDKNFFF